MRATHTNHPDTHENRDARGSRGPIRVSGFEATSPSLPSESLASVLRVLVVDDEPSVLHSTVLLLAALGFEPHERGNCSEVLNALRDVRPDVLLQDTRMPGLNVDQLVSEIRADTANSDLRIVLFTASLDAADLAERLGVPLLEKPFSPDALAAVLATPSPIQAAPPPTTP